jgi:hypothetical protein
MDCRTDESKTRVAENSEYRDAGVSCRTPVIIGYRPLLAHIAGDVKAGVFMSQVIYWYGKVKRPFYKTYAEWSAETGLSRHELDAVRKRWRRLGVLKEKFKGQPAKLFYDLDISRLNSLWKDALEGVFPASVPPKPLKSHSLPKTGKLVAENRQARLPKSGNHTEDYLQKTTTENSVLQTAPFSKNGADGVDSQTKEGAFLGKVQRHLRAYQGPQLYRLSHGKLTTVQRWYEECRELEEANDAHLGDPIGGWAQRLAGELALILQQHGIET